MIDARTLNEASRNVMLLKATLTQVQMALAQAERLYESMACDGNEASTREKQLCQILITEPTLIATARLYIAPSQIQHQPTRKILTELYRAYANGTPIIMDSIGPRLDSEQALSLLVQYAYIGKQMNNRAEWLRRIIDSYNGIDRQEPRPDDAQALELLASLKPIQPR